MVPENWTEDPPMAAAAETASAVACSNFEASFPIAGHEKHSEPDITCTARSMLMQYVTLLSQNCVSHLVMLLTGNRIGGLRTCAYRSLEAVQGEAVHGKLNCSDIVLYLNPHCIAPVCIMHLSCLAGSASCP